MGQNLLNTPNIIFNKHLKLLYLDSKQHLEMILHGVFNKFDGGF